MVFRNAAVRRLLMIFNFDTMEVLLPSVVGEGLWNVELNSADSQWLGPLNQFPRVMDLTNAIALPGQSFVILSREGSD
jgi:hypothetical protein